MQTSEQRSSDGSQQTAVGAFGDLLPSLSLPKGSEAIKGIEEKFGANPVTRTGSFTIRIFTSPGHSGWSLSIPSITRKTDRGLPRYEDEEESDVFILSEAADLVPKLVQASMKSPSQPKELTGCASHASCLDRRAFVAPDSISSSSVFVNLHGEHV